MPILEPTVTVICRPAFDEPHVDRWLDLNKSAWKGRHGSDAEILSEFAGRICYMSFGKGQGTKGTGQYLENILLQEHGSVLEHASFSLLIEGVSRSLTHELVRHRVGTAYSQLSQRYVDESAVQVVVPPLYTHDTLMLDYFTKLEQTIRENYVDVVVYNENRLRESDLSLSKKDLRKRAREAARSILPNCVETKLVMTANIRTWRWLCELRGSKAAEAEIRRLFVVITQLLQKEIPLLMSDMKVVNGIVTVTHRKV